MAGTEDYSFYYSLENSPFWIKKPVSEESDIQIQNWEKKLVTSPKHFRGSQNSKLGSHHFYGFQCYLLTPLILQFLDDLNESRGPNPSFGIMRLAAENLLCHPFLVLRRQCQVKAQTTNF